MVSLTIGPDIRAASAKLEPDEAMEERCLWGHGSTVLRYQKVDRLSQLHTSNILHPLHKSFCNLANTDADATDMNLLQVMQDLDILVNSDNIVY